MTKHSFTYSEDEKPAKRSGKSKVSKSKKAVNRKSQLTSKTKQVTPKTKKENSVGARSTIKSRRAASKSSITVKKESDSDDFETEPQKPDQHSNKPSSRKRSSSQSYPPSKQVRVKAEAKPEDVESRVNHLLTKAKQVHKSKILTPIQLLDRAVEVVSLHSFHSRLTNGGSIVAKMAITTGPPCNTMEWCSNHSMFPTESLSITMESQ